MVKKDQEKVTNTNDKQDDQDDEIRYRIRPTRYLNYDCAENTWNMEFHLPGVDKNNIDLKFLNNAYALKARRDQALYHNSEYLPFEIDEKTIEADYSNGLLYVKGHIKDPMDDAVEIKLE